MMMSIVKNRQESKKLHFSVIAYRQRMDALEATALLQKIMEEIDVAILSFDEHDKL